MQYVEGGRIKVRRRELSFYNGGEYSAHGGVSKEYLLVLYIRMTVFFTYLQ